MPIPDRLRIRRQLLDQTAFNLQGPLPGEVYLPGDVSLVFSYPHGIGPDKQAHALKVDSSGALVTSGGGGGLTAAYLVDNLGNPLNLTGEVLNVQVVGTVAPAANGYTHFTLLGAGAHNNSEVSASLSTATITEGFAVLLVTGTSADNNTITIQASMDNANWDVYCQVSPNNILNTAGLVYMVPLVWGASHQGFNLNNGNVPSGKTPFPAYIRAFTASNGHWNGTVEVYVR